jgi:purine-binding chemotaxis protein CheW
MTTDQQVEAYIDGMLADEPARADTPSAPQTPPPHAPTAQLAVAAAPAHGPASTPAPPVAAAVSPARPKRWLCFNAGGEHFAVELLKVQEVQRVPAIVAVRGAAPDVLGVINLRGEIVHVVDTAMRLGLGASEPASETSRVIVLEEGGRHVGLVVHGVANVVTLQESAIEHPDIALRAFPCAALIGIARHAQTLIVLLDASGFLK